MFILEIYRIEIPRVHETVVNNIIFKSVTFKDDYFVTLTDDVPGRSDRSVIFSRDSNPYVLFADLMTCTPLNCSVRFSIPFIRFSRTRRFRFIRDGGKSVDDTPSRLYDRLENAVVPISHEFYSVLTK